MKSPTHVEQAWVWRVCMSTAVLCLLCLARSPGLGFRGLGFRVGKAAVAVLYSHHGVNISGVRMKLLCPRLPRPPTVCARNIKPAAINLKLKP